MRHSGSPIAAFLLLIPAPCLAGGLTTLLNFHDYAALTQEHISEGHTETGDSLGASFAAGDFDGDGLMDLAVGVPGESQGGDEGAGWVIVLQGSGGGPAAGHMETLDQDDDVPMSAGEPYDRFGWAMTAGDFDGDGFHDLVVAVPYEETTSADSAGLVCVFPGSPDGPTVGSYFTQTVAGGTSEEGDLFGFSVTAGNVNGDAYDDLVVGSPGEAYGSDPQGGVAYLFLGSETGLGAGTVFDQEDAGGTSEHGDLFGMAVAAGNFNGDAYDDVVVGSPGEAVGAQPKAGVCYLFRGSSSGLIMPGKRFDQAGAGGSIEDDDEFGRTLAAGDFNGDPYADLAVGAPGESAGSDAGAGAVFIFYGTADSLGSGEFFTEDGTGGTSEPGERFGAALATGDLDGDGFDDLAVGAPFDSPLAGEPFSGGVYLFPGGAGGLSEGTLHHQESLGDGATNETGDRYGYALAIADHNGDGAEDLTIGVPGEDPFGDPHGGDIWIHAGKGPQPALTHGGLVGATTGTGTKIWGRADRAAQLSLQYKLPASPWPGTAAGPVTLAAGGDFTGVIEFTSLSPATRYDYRLLLDGVVQPASTASFRTLPPEGAPGMLTFAVCGDTRFQNNNPWGLIDSIATHDPDFLVQTGDQIYADAPKDLVDSVAGNLPSLEAAYERKYRECWAEPNFRRFTRSHPTFMIWDDHEIDNDWDQGTTGRYVEAAAAYEEYQGSHNPAPRAPGGNYYSFRAGDVDFYVLDVRTYRSPNGDPDDASKTMLGAAQKADLKNWLTGATGRFKFILSGPGWRSLVSGGSDTWDRFTTERNEIFAHIAANEVTGVVLLSGDQHYASVHRLLQVAPYYLYEFNATPVGYLEPGTPGTAQMADELFTYDGSANFGVFRVDTSDTTAGGATLAFDVYDDTNTSVFHMELGESQLVPTAVPPEPEETESWVSGGLFPSSPNPFTARTTIGFALRAAGRARLSLYDVEGRRVATLLDGELPAGRHQAVLEAGGLPSGVYFYELAANGVTERRKTVLAR